MVQQMAIYEQGCGLMVSIFPPPPNEGSNLSRQDAGQNMFRFLTIGP